MAVDAAPRDDFRQKLILSVVDKLVFGLLIVLAGFVLNFVLENHRADQAMKTEIARLRVQKVAETWQALDRHQQAVNAVGRLEVGAVYASLVALTQSTASPDAYNLRAEKANRLRTSRMTRSAALRRGQERLIARLRSNRFWIGERLYPEYVEYVASQMRLHEAYRNASDTLIREVSVRVDEFNAYVAQGKKGLSEADRASLIAESRAVYDEAMREVRERKRELDESRADVFSAMERLS
jgi:hypothetical protein